MVIVLGVIAGRFMAAGHWPALGGEQPADGLGGYLLGALALAGGPPRRG